MLYQLSYEVFLEAGQVLDFICNFHLYCFFYSCFFSFILFYSFILSALLLARVGDWVSLACYTWMCLNRDWNRYCTQCNVAASTSYSLLSRVHVVHVVLTVDWLPSHVVTYFAANTLPVVPLHVIAFSDLDDLWVIKIKKSP